MDDLVQTGVRRSIGKRPLVFSSRKRRGFLATVRIALDELENGAVSP